MIDSAVRSDEFIDDMGQQFGSLGVRHCAYGVNPEDYPFHGEALMAMLQAVVGKGWSDRHSDAWSWMCAGMTETMLVQETIGTLFCNRD